MRTKCVFILSEWCCYIIALTGEQFVEISCGNSRLNKSKDY